MEKAVMEVWRTKKNTITGKFTLEDGKPLYFTSWLNDQVDESYNNKECFILREQGQLTKVVVGDKEFKKHSGAIDSQKKSSKNKVAHEDNLSTEREAVAPYNFVPLNEKVVLVDKDIPSHDFYNLNRLSGRIELKIKTQTPFFIRNIAKLSDMPKNENEVEDQDFFSPGGNLKIPGSSLRGMVRTLVEIVGHGKFVNSDLEKRLYYRFIGEKGPLQKEYNKNMINKQNNQIQIKGGVLRQSNNGQGTYKIIPSPRQGLAVYRVNKNTIKNANISLEVPEEKNYNFKEIFFEPAAPSKPVQKIYTKEPANPKADLRAGYLVCSGSMPNKKRQWIIENPGPNTKPLQIPSEVVTSYQQDENRNAVNLLEELKNNSAEEIPCFYMTDSEDRVISFGHTGFFRLAYDKKIGDHVPEALKINEEKFDIAESIFGVANHFASRVYFEDAALIPDQGNPYLHQDYRHPKILSTPKPTTFQHYLVQGKRNDHKVVDKNNLMTWNKDTMLRGYKLYWHRDINMAEAPDNWEAPQGAPEQARTQYKYRIKPVRREICFKGDIRFENLSKEELGALLFVLDLPQNCYHKLGLAKPLGLGSVEIKPTLILIDREKRYKNLFHDRVWDLAENNSDPSDYKVSFAGYMLDQLGITAEQSSNKVEKFWSLERMQELKSILSWPPANKYWLKETRYMSISGDGKTFKDRPVLPKASVVFKKFK